MTAADTAKSAMWQETLASRFPSLFEFQHGEPTLPDGYAEVNDGWRELIETALTRIAALVTEKPADTIHIEQIKEKYGTLRLYWQGRFDDDRLYAAINEIVLLAEARSACTCEICGEEGKLRKSRNGWLATACDAHAQGDVVPSRSGTSNVYISYLYKKNEPAGARYRMYDRASDSFIEVDPEAIGVKQ